MKPRITMRTTDSGERVYRVQNSVSKSEFWNLSTAADLALYCQGLDDAKSGNPQHKNNIDYMSGYEQGRRIWR